MGSTLSNFKGLADEIGAKMAACGPSAVEGAWKDVIAHYSNIDPFQDQLSSVYNKYFQQHVAEGAVRLPDLTASSKSTGHLYILGKTLTTIIELMQHISGDVAMNEAHPLTNRQCNQYELVSPTNSIIVETGNYVRGLLGKQKLDADRYQKIIKPSWVQKFITYLDQDPVRSPLGFSAGRFIDNSSPSADVPIQTQVGSGKVVINKHQAGANEYGIDALGVARKYDISALTHLVSTELRAHPDKAIIITMPEL